MRIFLAVDINDEQRVELAGIQKYLSDKLSKIKWVMPENLHITMKFLGELEPEEADRVATILNKPLKSFSSFPIEPGGLGVFPNIKRPRVFWAGLRKGHDELINLSRIVEDTVSAAGFDKDTKPFSPHITLGRFRQPPNGKAVEETIKNAPQLKPSEHIVSGISIYQSILKPEGPQYKLLHFLRTKS